jgi:hypothetical protein
MFFNGYRFLQKNIAKVTEFLNSVTFADCCIARERHVKVTELPKLPLFFTYSYIYTQEKKYFLFFLFYLSPIYIAILFW